jgi:hypothetical protein
VLITLGSRVKPEDDRMVLNGELGHFHLPPLKGEGMREGSFLVPQENDPLLDPPPCRGR